MPCTVKPKAATAGCGARVDVAKIGLVHPQLPLRVCTTLGIPALEAVVAEELSPECRPRRIASIQVQAAAHANSGNQTELPVLERLCRGSSGREQLLYSGWGRAAETSAC